MEPTGISGYTRCIKCGKVIATTRQFITEHGFEYATKDEDCRYIDKWGFSRNFCKECMK